LALELRVGLKTGEERGSAEERSKDLFVSHGVNGKREWLRGKEDSAPGYG
jgi:hypothetical protein